MLFLRTPLRNKVSRWEEQLARQIALEGLPDRERQVVELRYGLDGEKPRTLEQVGRTLGVTRERVRQLEAQALKKMRAARGAAA